MNCNHSHRSNRDLPNTPRVNDKIIEYFREFGQERDLQKFMRLYSPVSSQDSQKTQAYCVSSDYSCKQTKSSETVASADHFEELSMLPLNTCGITNSKSLPNIDVQHGQHGSKREYFSSNDVLVDVTIEAKGEKEKILNISTENLKTPSKTFKNTKTQTPDSVAKTHKRLEWDSLGDVGYKKSMSTSNISTIERSLLKEFFKEKRIPLETSTSSDGKMKNITNENTIVKLKRSEVEHSTPPLACSTLVTTTENGAKPKKISQSTSSTSLNEQFEKYVQTSLPKPPTVLSQAIQCTMSSSNSTMESTPSSFEYYSSKSSENLRNTNSKKQFKPLNNPFITSITELLLERKTVDEKKQQKRRANIHELQTKFRAALNENKENQSHSTVDSSTASSFSISKQAPELDLGIQLICSLIEAKNINTKQKKQLIRDIIKRIQFLESEDKTNCTTPVNIGEVTTSNSTDCHHYDTVSSNVNNVHQREVMETDSTKFRLISTTKEKANSQEQYITSANNACDNICSILGAKLLNFPKSHTFQHINKCGCKHFPYNINLHKNSEKEISVDVSRAAATTIDKETQSGLIRMEQNKHANKQTTFNRKLTTKAALQTENLKMFPDKKWNRWTQTSKTSLNTTLDASSTPDVITEKLVVTPCNEFNNSNTDTEQPTLRECLNPLTQSEIEYEEKKETQLRQKAAAQQQKLLNKSKNNYGRFQQINWIENEIQRLECLKHLLLTDETTRKSSMSAPTLNHSEQKNLNKESLRTDKLYDTVYSEKSSALTESGEHLMQEVEIILEESHEDDINIKDNTKRTKDRTKETKIIYERQKDNLGKSKINSIPKFRVVNENIKVHEEQLSNSSNTETNHRQQQQREKMDTPSTNKSEMSESWRDLVLQRNKEFMEAYKSKRRHHCDALKQKQREDLNYLNLQRKLRENTKSATDSEHYSVPHTLPRKYSLSLPQSKIESKIKSCNRQCSREISIAQHQSSTQSSHTTINNSSSSKNDNTKNSSSSMFCESSEVSVPMGSQDNSSTPTTTHQYDDVTGATNATEVAVQTSDSIMHSKPIFGPTLALHATVPTFRSTACTQVKPKGIAYIIEFDDNKNSSSSFTSGNEINSSNELRKPYALSNHSITKQLTNNFKCLKPFEAPLTLQDHLEKRKPKFLQKCKERRAVLNKLQSLRQERDRQLREIIDNTSYNSINRRLQYLPPPPMQNTRILKTKEMKALTYKRFANLPEVVAIQERETEEKRRRGNRILRDVFNKRLQKRVRSGKLSLNHSKTII